MDAGTLLSDRYRLEHPIGRGAMGAVWRAVDERLERPVAVKLLLPGLESSRERFIREARTLAALKGRHYVEVYDVGVALDGDRTVQYLVMELIEGESLARVIQAEGAPDPVRTMRIIADAAEALGTAHGRGIVHRDVKPANLLIEEGDRVRVVDFGISLLVDRSRLTDSEEALGSVPYVSPERLRNRDVTGKSDLYSLGAVAHECLTGTPPRTRWRSSTATSTRSPRHSWTRSRPRSPTFEAREALEDEGFGNAVASVGYYAYSPEPEHCQVMRQSPPAGSTADYAEQITLHYHERQAEGTTCEW